MQILTARIIHETRVFAPLLHCAGHTALARPSSSGGPPRPRRALSNEPRRAAIRAVGRPHVRRGANLSLTCRSRDVPCGHVGPPEAVPRCGSVGYDPGGSLVLPWPHVATVYVSQRVLCRFVVTRRSSSTVAPRRALHHSPPPRARVVRVTRSFTPPRPPTTRASWNDVVRQPAVSNTPVAACGRESSPITRLCRQAPMMAKDMHPSHVLVWLLEPRECFFAAYICRT